MAHGIKGAFFILTMNDQRHLIISLILLTLLPLSGQSDSEDPLFASEETLPLVIEAPFSLLRLEDDKDIDYEGRIIAGKVEIPVKLNVRGGFRLELCDQPPLKLDLDKDSARDTLFDKQYEMKLVIPCKSSSRYEQYVRLEYLAYKFYNLVSDQSFKVRWLDIKWTDSGRRSSPDQVPGFLIERKKRMGKRIERDQVKKGSAKIRELEVRAAARVSLFMYMIGNLDYSIVHSASDDECCHNTKLMGHEGDGGHVPVPYDFDNSGLVNTPYAKPPDDINVFSVTNRRYRGFCAFNAGMEAAVADFLNVRDEAIALFKTDPYLREYFSDRSSRFIEESFDHIAEPVRVEENILSRCR